MKKKIRNDENKFKKLKVSKFKLPHYKLPKIKLPKFNLPKIKIKLPKFKPSRINLPKINLPPIKLPKISLPKFKLPVFKIKVPKFPESNLVKQFKGVDFGSEKAAIQKDEKYLADVANKSLRATREIYGDIHSLLVKIFGSKSQKQLIEDFEKYFVDTGKFTRKHSNALREIVNVVKKFDVGKIEHHERHRTIRKNAAIFLNDLFGHLKSNKLIHPGKEFRGMERKIKTYSKELNSAVLFSRRTFRNAKDALRRSDKVIHSRYSETRDNVQELHKKMWEVQKRQKEIKLKKGFFENRFESKGKIAKRLADEVSRDVKDDSKNHKMKDITEAISETEKKSFE